MTLKMIHKTGVKITVIENLIALTLTYVFRWNWSRGGGEHENNESNGQ